MTAPAETAMDMEAMPGMDHSKMNHDSMPGMDHQMIRPARAQYHGHDMNHGGATSGKVDAMSSMNHGGGNPCPCRSSAPPDARDPHAYSDGYDFGPIPRPQMGDEEILGSLLVDRLESATNRGSTAMTYDWQAWFGNTYDRALIRAEGEY